MCCKKKVVEVHIFKNNDWKKLVTNDISKDTPIVKPFNREGWTKKEKQDDVPNSDGVYCFVANDDIKVTVKKLFADFIMVDRNLKMHLMCSPKINYKKDFDGDGEIIFKKDELIYVGECKNLKSRYNQHMSEKLDKTNSMKFGLRKFLDGKYDYYYKEKEADKQSDDETKTRNDYGCWFGE